MKSRGTWYRGWKLSYSESRPVTGLWRAERYGVGMCAGTEAAITRMIDVRITEETNTRVARMQENRK